MKKSTRNITISLIVLGIGIIIIGIYYNLKNSSETPIPKINSTTIHATSTISTNDWKTYTNSKYNFQFKYPPGLSTFSEYPRGMECSKVYGDSDIDFSDAVTVITADNFEVDVYCDQLQFSSPTSTLDTSEIAGLEAYTKYLKNTNDMTIKVSQVPLEYGSRYQRTADIFIDSTHFIGVTYEYDIQPNSESTGYNINNEEWAVFLNSFKPNK